MNYELLLNDENSLSNCGARQSRYHGRKLIEQLICSVGDPDEHIRHVYVLSAPAEYKWKKSWLPIALIAYLSGKIQGTMSKNA